MKLLLQKLISLVTVWGLLFLGVVSIHEWCHVMATRILRGDAYVSYSPGYVATGGFTHFYVVPDHNLWFVYLSGGIGVFLGCMLLWTWSYLSKTMWDMYIELPALSIALWQFCYALLETFVYPNNPIFFSEIAGITMIVGAFVAIGIEGRRLWKWLTTKESITRKEYYI